MRREAHTWPRQTAGHPGGLPLPLGAVSCHGYREAGRGDERVPNWRPPTPPGHCLIRASLAFPLTGLPASRTTQRSHSHWGDLPHTQNLHSGQPPVQTVSRTPPRRQVTAKHLSSWPGRSPLPWSLRPPAPPPSTCPLPHGPTHTNCEHSESLMFPLQGAPVPPCTPWCPSRPSQTREPVLPIGLTLSCGRIGPSLLCGQFPVSNQCPFPGPP